MSKLKSFSTNKKETIQEITTKMLLLIRLTEKLPAESLRVLELYYLQDKSLKEICTIIGKSMTVVRNHLNRGIFFLKEFYEAEVNQR